MIVNTPGVYIRETNTLPASVVGVSTAVPVFVGFTQNVPAQPLRISGMMEFEAAFGGAYRTQYTFSVGSAPAFAISDLKPDLRFFLYDSLNLYFRNGGGPCYVISAGDFATVTTDYETQLQAAITSIEILDEPTLILVPDLHVRYTDGGILKGLTLSQYGNLAAQALTLCGESQDKFTLLDYLNMGNTAQEMRNHVNSTGNLKYGALYFPWLKNSETLSLNTRYISPSMGTISGSQRETDLFDLVGNYNNLQNDLGGRWTLESAMAHFHHLKNQLDVNNTKTNFKAAIAFLYGLIASLDGVSLTDTDLIAAREDLKTNQKLIQAIRHLYKFKHETAVYLPTSGAALPTPGSTAWYNETGDSYTTVADVETNYNPNPFFAMNSPTDPTKKGVLEILESGTWVNLQVIFSSVAGLFDLAEFKLKQLETRLFEEDPVYVNIQKAILEDLKQVPSQGAVAGIYCRNDRERGVWKSPANYALQGIEKPVVEVSNREQDLLNVDASTGKSINVIRTFTGKGTLIWGARTLEGNSNEWRYIAVRRFFSFAEESIKKAMNEFVFEPNNARTWVKIKAMVTSFLVTQWRAGALTGTQMEDAFFVRVGEETTSEAEILAGKINVQIGMAVARPAEFIILEFTHQSKA